MLHILSSRISRIQLYFCLFVITVVGIAVAPLPSPSLDGNIWTFFFFKFFITIICQFIVFINIKLCLIFIALSNLGGSFFRPLFLCVSFFVCTLHVNTIHNMKTNYTDVWIFIYMYINWKIFIAIDYQIDRPHWNYDCIDFACLLTYLCLVALCTRATKWIHV